MDLLISKNCRLSSGEEVSKGKTDWQKEAPGCSWGAVEKWKQWPSLAHPEKENAQDMFLQSLKIDGEALVKPQGVFKCQQFPPIRMT